MRGGNWLNGGLCLSGLRLTLNEFVRSLKRKNELLLIGPQIELDSGEGLSICDEDPPVEVPGVVPTVVVEEEDSSVEFVVSGKETKSDQAEEQGLSLFLRMPSGERKGWLLEQGLSLILRRLRGKQGLYLIWDQGRVIFALKISLATNLKKWENSLLRNHLKPHLFLAQNSQ